MIQRTLAKMAVKQLVKIAQARALPSLAQSAQAGLRALPPAGSARPSSPVRTYAEFVKLSHTVFALPFALASMAVAVRDQHGWPGWRIFGLILAAMVTARTCAMSFNRIVDRKFDQENPRTAQRHLPTGKISLWGASMLCLGSGAAFLLSAYLINPLCFLLSPVALFLVCFYSLTKRFTDFTHIYLGVALALAPLGAWLAVKGGFVLWPMKESIILPLLLAVAVIFWLVGFDIIYAIQDYQFDKAHGLHSAVVRWGPANALGVAFLSHLCMWSVLAVFGLLCRFGLPYMMGLFIILVSLVMEHWLARKRSMKWIDTAFFRLNAFISVVFLVVTVAEVAFPRFTFLR